MRDCSLLVIIVVLLVVTTTTRHIITMVTVMSGAYHGCDGKMSVEVVVTLLLLVVIDVRENCGDNG